MELVKKKELGNVRTASGGAGIRTSFVLISSSYRSINYSHTNVREHCVFAPLRNRMSSDYFI